MFPIFAFSCFIILYLLQLFLTLLIFTAAASPVIDFISNFCLIAWLIFRIGPTATFQKLKSIKGLKRFSLQAIGGFIPVLDFFPWAPWFVYMTYKDEKADKKLEILAAEQQEVVGALEEQFSATGIEQPDLLKTQMGQQILTPGGVSPVLSDTRPAGLDRITQIEIARKERKKMRDINLQKSQKKYSEKDLEKIQSTEEAMKLVGTILSGKKFAKPKVLSEELSGEELLPTSPSAFIRGYAGEKMTASNEPEFYKEVIQQQNLIEEKRVQDLRLQGLQQQKENLASQLQNLLRMRNQAVQRYGAKSKYVERLEAKVSEFSKLPKVE